MDGCRHDGKVEWIVRMMCVCVCVLGVYVIVNSINKEIITSRNEEMIVINIHNF